VLVNVKSTMVDADYFFIIMFL